MAGPRSGRNVPPEGRVEEVTTRTVVPRVGRKGGPIREGLHVTSLTLTEIRGTRDLGILGPGARPLSLEIWSTADHPPSRLLRLHPEPRQFGCHLLDGQAHHVFV